jgi:hypothetical protein
MNVSPTHNIALLFVILFLICVSNAEQRIELRAQLVVTRYVDVTLQYRNLQNACRDWICTSICDLDNFVTRSFSFRDKLATTVFTGVAHG